MMPKDVPCSLEGHYKPLLKAKGEFKAPERESTQVLLDRQLGITEDPTPDDLHKDVVWRKSYNTSPSNRSFIFLNNSMCPQVQVDVKNPLCEILPLGINPLETACLAICDYDSEHDSFSPEAICILYWFCILCMEHPGTINFMDPSLYQNQADITQLQSFGVEIRRLLLGRGGHIIIPSATSETLRLTRISVKYEKLKIDVVVCTRGREYLNVTLVQGGHRIPYQMSRDAFYLRLPRILGAPEFSPKVPPKKIWEYGAVGLFSMAMTVEDVLQAVKHGFPDLWTLSLPDILEFQLYFIKEYRYFFGLIKEMDPVDLRCLKERILQDLKAADRRAIVDHSQR